MNSLDDKTKAKLIVQITSILALVALAAIDAFSKDFQVSIIVYAIIGGILFGVGGIRELIGGITIEHKKDDKKDDK